MSRSRLVTRALFIFVVLTTSPMVQADLPPMIWTNERLAPTNQDWFRYFYGRQVRQQRMAVQSAPVEAPCHRCEKKACCEVGPLVLWPEIVYFPCAPCGKQCGPLHPSMKGCYGMAFPMPYYIPNPTIAVEVNDWCEKPGSQQNWRFPNNRVEITIPVWE